MYTLWGIGTTFYGKADVRQHPRYGVTYITTVWFVIVGLPLIPIRSMRIGGVNTKFSQPYSKTSSFYILEHLPIQWRQALRTFVLSWGIVLIVIGALTQVPPPPK